MNKLLLLAIIMGLAACGPDDHLTVNPDAGSGGPAAGTFTAYVIDLIDHHTADTAPRPYSEFSGLPDPDGDSNNTAAYTPLFP